MQRPLLALSVSFPVELNQFSYEIRQSHVADEGTGEGSGDPHIPCRSGDFTN